MINKLLEGSEIKQSLDLYQAIFDECQFGLIVVNNDRKVVVWNPWVTKSSGLRLERAQNKLFSELFPRILNSSLGRAVDVALSHGMSSVISHSLNANILPLFSTDGAPIDQQLKIKPLGRVKESRLCLIQINDITAAVKRDKQLRENLAELHYQQYALDQHAIVAVTDVDGTITYVNDLFCKISHYSREELIGNNHRLINSGTHSTEFFRDMFRTISSGQVWNGDICNRAKNGELYWVSTTIVPDMDSHGKPRRYFAIRADITKLKRAEEAANAAAVTKSQFLANMSHEIRTPMNAILGLTREVMETELKQFQRDQLNKVWKSSQALIHIINDILDFSRFESGYVSLEQVSIQLESVLLDVSNLFGAQIEEKGLELFVEIDPATPLCVMSDALRLTQVLNNLIGNAVKFTVHGEIYLSVALVSRDNDAITLSFSVVDTGIGILPEQIKLLFNPFVQADNSTTRKFGGSGLGLSIVKKLVELMGGEISIESNFGQGTTVNFTITVGVAPNDMQTPLNLLQDLHQLAGKRVLVVDDQEIACHILVRLIKAWGMQVVAVQSGYTALELIAQANRENRPFYAVLVDWRMPGMDGLKVAVAIKAQTASTGGDQTLNVLMVTAYDKQSLMRQPEAEYIDGILTKPVVPSALFDVLLGKKVFQLEPFHERNIRNFSGFRVLLVEDHELNQEVVVNFMKKRGVDIKVAWHGGEAVEMVKQQAFDLVLMDLHMPVMGGYEATKLIRTLPEGRDLPIVAMTAAVLAEDRKLCLDAGMNDFIAKPIEPDDLERVMNRYFKGLNINEVVQSVTHEEDLVLDLAQGLYRLDGDKALQLRLLISFSERYHDVTERLNALLIEKNTAEAIDLVHGLKGVAANLGAVTLAEACRRLLDEMKAGDITSRTHFAAAVIETLRRIQHFIINYMPPDAHQASQATVISVAELLQALEGYISKREIIPDALLADLRQLADADLPCSAQLGQLQHHLSNFEHRNSHDIFRVLVAEYGKS